MDYITVTNALIDYYVNLLIIQYHDKPRARATIALLIRSFLANFIFMQIRDAFDWKTATGKNLDIVGAWEGISRFYDGQLFTFQAWFALPGWDDITDNYQGGFSDFSDFDTLSGGFLDYENVATNKNRLEDEAFRLIIGLKIIKNQIKHTAKPIDDAVYSYFNGDVYTKWEGNTLVYYHTWELTSVMQVAAYKNVLPVPTGVKIELREI